MIYMKPCLKISFPPWDIRDQHGIPPWDIRAQHGPNLVFFHSKDSSSWTLCAEWLAGDEDGMVLGPASKLRSLTGGRGVYFCWLATSDVSSSCLTRKSLYSSRSLLPTLRYPRSAFLFYPDSSQFIPCEVPVILLDSFFQKSLISKIDSAFPSISVLLRLMLHTL